MGICWLTFYLRLFPITSCQAIIMRFPSLYFCEVFRSVFELDEKTTQWYFFSFFHDRWHRSYWRLMFKNICDSLGIWDSNHWVVNVNSFFSSSIGHNSQSCCGSVIRSTQTGIWLQVWNKTWDWFIPEQTVLLGSWGQSWFGDDSGQLWGHKSFVESYCLQWWDLRFALSVGDDYQTV